MSIWVRKIYKYAYAYYMNWSYLENMTALQMKPLDETTWDEDYEPILTDLSGLPWAFSSKEEAKESVIDILIVLEHEIMRL